MDACSLDKNSVQKVWRLNFLSVCLSPLWHSLILPDCIQLHFLPSPFPPPFFSLSLYILLPLSHLPLPPFSLPSSPLLTLSSLSASSSFCVSVQSLCSAELPVYHTPLLLQVIFAGGATKLPSVNKKVQDFFPKAEFFSTIPADEVIAIGAAKQVGHALITYCLLLYCYPQTEEFSDLTGRYRGLWLEYWRLVSEGWDALSLSGYLGVSTGQ